MLARNLLFLLSISGAFIGGTQFPELTQNIPVAQNASEAPNCQTAGAGSAPKQVDSIVSNKKSATKEHQHDDFKNVAQAKETYDAADDSSAPTTLITDGLKNSHEFKGWLNDNIEKSPTFDIGNAMQQGFNQEMRDSDWAETEETKVSDLFFESEHLEGLALRDIECRKTQCRLSIAVNNLDQANNTVDNLLNSFVSQQEFRQIVAAPNLAENVTTLYVSRDSGGLSFNQ